MTHFIVWEHSADTVDRKVACDAPEGARCRLVCLEDDCEQIRIEYIVAGKPFHWVNDFEERRHSVRHDLVDGGYCNVCEWLNADTSLIEELDAKRETFEIGRVAIVPVWDGDGFEWERA